MTAPAVTPAEADGVVLLPWADYARELGPAVGGLSVAVYGEGEDPPAQDVLDRVAFYVPPYLGGRRALALMARMPRLQVLQTLTAGVDNVWDHLPPGVAVHNAAGVHDASTAELAVGLTIARLRGLDESARAQSQGRWAAQHHDALADKTVLILGYGQIGRAIEARLSGFEVEVVRVARTAREQDGQLVHGYQDLPALLPSADVVVLVVPLTAQTTAMVDARFLAAMKDGALLVNVARGKVVVTDDLVAELETGRLRAALDVTDPEPLAPDHPLWRAPGVLITPHVGGDTTAFLPRARRLVAEQLQRWRDGQPLANRMSQ
jgi:phosphoglycerate dehydrogenase-like enzyme